MESQSFLVLLSKQIMTRSKLDCYWLV